ncbi:MAG: FecR domain-containing protein [Leptolyngbya sp. SIOISBB]|nr:FecR domain-containing protein [Leptolyngbya sp. SIOISBB]
MIGGQARIQARPFTNPNTLLELQTPSGVAAVRGTDFGVIVDEAGKTSVGTVEGTVEVTAESVTVTVDEGLATLIRPGEPPTVPTRLDRELNLEWFQISRRGNTLALAGRIDPTNSLTYRNTEIPISPTGYFEQTVRLGSANRSVVFVVQNPLGESREHRLNSWQFNDIER